MKFVSLFAGIGGFDLGFERAGMTCAAQVEIDQFCQKVLAKHWPDVPRFGDIRNVGKHNLPQADVICGGFPCQPHSLAGKRKGSEDDRDLWPEYFRVVEELRPTWVVGENVPGIRTTILDQVLSDLESIEYSTVTLDIPAIAFNAPHRRHRFFVIAHANSATRRVSAIARQPEETTLSYWYGETQPLVRWSLGNQWSTEPELGRVAHGISNRVDRLRTLGNAVVPQVTEFIARSILHTENASNTACSGRLATSAQSELFIADGQTPSKARGATRRR